jgi:hypothetical protein
MPSRTAPPKPHQTTAEQHLLDCPVCLLPIKAEISVEATFGEATYHGPQDVTLPVETKLLAFNVLHSCDGPPPEEPKPADGGPTS